MKFVVVIFVSVLSVMPLCAGNSHVNLDSLSESRDSLKVGNEILDKFFPLSEDIDEEGKRLDKKKMNAIDYIPAIHGTIRAKYEYCPQERASRFQVRNARFSLTGNVHPIVAYKAEIDLSDKGKIKMLDAYVRVLPVKGLALTLGQMKVPFSTDNLRSPHNQFFANRAFVAKQLTSLRDVGFTASYDASAYFPIEIVAGVFNGSGLTSQSEWQVNMDYSARINVKPVKFFSFSLNWHSIKPDNLRMNLFDVGLMSDFYGVHLEAEGVYKLYQNNKFAPSYGINAFAAYDLKLPAVFDKLRFIARYDMMSENYNGIFDSENQEYDKPDPYRQRVTAGVTLALEKPVVAELRINYEKYFYEDWEIADPSEKDKLVIEVVARF